MLAHRPTRAGALATTLMVILLPRSSWADIQDEVAGVRSAAMGQSHRGLGTSNDTIMLNPAGMSMARRFAVDLQYSYAALDRLSRVAISTVDSKSGPVAGGFAYVHTRGDDADTDPSLHHILFALSYPVTDNLAFGMTGRHIRGTFKDRGGERPKLSLYSGDIGISGRLRGGLGFGLTYHNVVQSQREDLTPSAIGLGVAYNTATVIFSGDARAALSDATDTTWSYHTGVEYLLSGTYPLRAGYRRARFANKAGERPWENILSVGSGWISQTGALDISFWRSVERARHWQLIGAMKFFL